jgi:predicted secreted protein
MSHRSRDPAAVLELGEGRDAAASVAVGEPLELRLASAGTTGHLWQLHADPERVRVLSRDTVPDELSFGGRGVMRFVVEALRPGATDLRLELAAPWEPAPAREHTVRLEVGAG